MHYKDIREFIDRLEQDGQVSRVKVEVDLKYEVGAICSKNFDVGGLEESKALIFEKPKGYSTPVAVNLLGTRKRYCMAIDTTPDTIIPEWIERVKKPLEPVIVDHGPCKENIHIGDKADLSMVPVPTWNEKDGGPYITLPHHISKDPETGQRNMAIYRCQVHDNKTVGILANPMRHINMQWRKSHAKGESFPVAIAIGVDPALTLAATDPFLQGADEVAMAGALRCAPIEMVKCETIPLEVPATAEWVLEGEVRPNALRMEGPFGEGAGYYGDSTEKEFIEIKAITHRNNPIYQGAYLRKPPSEVLSLKHSWEVEAVRQCPLPSLVKLVLPQAGLCSGIAVAQIKKAYDGQGKMMGLALLGMAAGKFIKIVIVVDDDIDPNNWTDVMWAVTTRFQPERDIEILREQPGYELDPSIYPEWRAQNFTSKMIIDATKPHKKPFAEVAWPKKDVLEKVEKEWEKYGIS